MKEINKKELSKIFNYKISTKYVYVLLFVFIGILQVLYYSSCQFVIYYESGDSPSYVFYRLFENGRTPVYPFIIWILGLVFRENVLLSVVWVQIIISFLSHMLFARLIKMLTNSMVITVILTILYATNPAIIGWNNEIITESFSLSGTVFFIYSVLIYIREPTTKWGTVALYFTLLLTFLRPTFLYFYVSLIAFGILRFYLQKEERKILRKLLKHAVIGVFIIMAYSTVFYYHFGIWTISDPIPRQLMTICIDRKYTNSIHDVAFLTDCQSYLQEMDSLQASVQLTAKYGYNYVQKIAIQCISENFSQFIKDTLLLIEQLKLTIFFPYYTITTKAQGKISYINFLQYISSFLTIGSIIFFYIVYLIKSILGQIYRHKFSWSDLGILIFIPLIFLSSIVLTNSQYPRTMICILPFFYVLIGKLMNSNEDTYVL